MNRSMTTFLLVLLVSPFLFMGLVCGGCAACVTADGIVNGGPEAPRAKRAAPQKVLQTF